jgi:uncharacterized protein YvpB
MWALIFFVFRFPFLAFHPTNVSLAVPYVSQAPDGQWVLPWSQACEEASIIMVERYYHREKMMGPFDAKAAMEWMIEWENKHFNKNQDTDAKETRDLIAARGVFAAKVVREPTRSGIKNELAAKRPVIAMVNMYELYQEPTQADSYHVLVLTGYDDEKKEFIVNDPARERQRYPYDVVMKALHDFNQATHEADATATVLYTNASFLDQLFQ